MKNILIILCFICNSVYSQTVDEWFQKGEQAYGDENYEEAAEYYKKAANLGSIDACAILSYMYYYGAVNGKKDIEMASLWAKRVGANNILESDVVLALISYYKGEFSKTIEILEYWKEEALMTEAKLALAISYMVNGNERTRFLGKQKAEPLVKTVYDKTKKESDKPDYYYAACAILAKIEFDEKRDIQDEKMWKYLEKFGIPGKDDFVYCPLAECLIGNFFSRFADKDLRSMGEFRLEVAAQYDYNKRFKILYPFAPEIKAYYNKIK